MSYGPAPSRQQHWDWRAAGNFMGGGAGSGLLVFGPLLVGTTGERTMITLVGLALIATGLGCVWLEIGRPWRAFNVFFNSRSSWMSREASVAPLLFAFALAGIVYAPAGWPAAALALAFVYCQARMLGAARGIPAWRDPMLPVFVIATALAEGGGLLLALCALAGVAAPAHILLGFGSAIVARLLVWLVYRRRLGPGSPAAPALDAAGRMLQAGTVVSLLALIAGFFAGDAAALILAAMAGVSAAAAGAYAKFVLITRAAFTQGFTLPHLPVRGVRS